MLRPLEDSAPARLMTMSTAAAPPDAQPQRTVHLLGPLTVTGSEGLIESVPAGRASLLLCRIAVAAGATVTIDSLIDALWVESIPTTAERTTAALVSRVRSALGPQVILGSAVAGYRFGIGTEWTTDAMQAERLLTEARSRSTTAPALAATSAALGLQLLDRGQPIELAQSLDAPWFDEFRRHIDGLRRRFQRCLWDADIELGRWSELIDSAEVALATEPHDEEAGRALMLAHWNRGDRGAALHAHDLLRGQLLRAIGVEPGPETEALYGAIIRDEPSNAVARRASSAPTADDLRVAGRNAELIALATEWNTAAMGGFVSVVISGPIGSGRTSLVEALSETVEQTGGRVLRSECAKGERSLFLHPILTMLTTAILSTAPDDIPGLLGPHLGTATELIPELRQLCPVPSYRRASDELEHRRALQAISHILGQMASRHPMLLVFDDFHHAGASTVEATQWLRRELRDHRVLLVATVQADQGERQLADFAAQSTHIALHPVPRDTVVELAVAAGFPNEADLVWDATRGHLFFVKSVLDALQRGFPIEQISGSVGSVVMAGARQAGADVVRVLQAAATIGNSFDLVTLGHVVKLERSVLIASIEAATTASLVEARDDRFAFSNRLIQQVMSESIVAPIRLEHHQRVAEISDDEPERRAWHLREAGDLVKAVGAWLEAARLAQRAFSNTDAERLFTEAISSAEQCGDDACLGEALIGRGNVRTELGEYDEATEDHLRAEALAIGLGDRQLRVRAVERLGWIAYYERDVSVAVARAEEAVGIPGAHPSAQVLLGRIRHWAGDFDSASDAYERALSELADEDAAIKASALSCLGALLAHNDKYSQAVDVLEESVALCREIGAFRPLLRSLFFEGLAKANSGDLSGALTTFETKRTLLERYGVSFYRARTDTCLAWVWRELGDHGRSWSLSERALEESREVDEGELQVEQELHALCSLAECSIVNAQPDEAAARLDDAQLLLDQWLPFRWRAELRVMELKSRIGAASAEELLVASRACDSRKYESLALHQLGRVEDATAMATRTGSLLLLVEVGAPDVANDASRRLVARLPRQLREGFGSHGRLARQNA